MVIPADAGGTARDIARCEWLNEGRDFEQHTISENAYAGNAINRRLFFQYRVLLPASPYGHADRGERASDALRSR